MSNRAPDNSPGPVRHILFICTGNYYRSRFAEELFNALASRSGLEWRADSRGLATEWRMGNLGPVSSQVVTELAKLGVWADTHRYPVQLREADLARAGLVIALNEAEHRPLLRERFPGWDERVEYWDIADLGYAPASETLPELQRQVRALLRRLESA